MRLCLWVRVPLRVRLARVCVVCVVCVCDSSYIQFTPRPTDRSRVRRHSGVIDSSSADQKRRSDRVKATFPLTSCKGITMNKDQVKGRAEQVKGSVKEATGKIVGNKSLEAEGKIDKATGKVKATYGDLKEDVKDAIKRP